MLQIDVKAHSNFITSSNNFSGVAFALENYIFKGEDTKNG